MESAVVPWLGGNKCPYSGGIYSRRGMPHDV